MSNLQGKIVCFVFPQVLMFPRLCLYKQRDLGKPNLSFLFGPDVEWILSLTDSFDFKETSAGRKGLRKEQPSQLFVSTISWENLAKLVLSKIPARVGKTSYSESWQIWSVIITSP